MANGRLFEGNLVSQARLGYRCRITIRSLSRWQSRSGDSNDSFEDYRARNSRERAQEWSKDKTMSNRRREEPRRETPEHFKRIIVLAQSGAAGGRAAIAYRHVAPVALYPTDNYSHSR